METLRWVAIMSQRWTFDLMYPQPHPGKTLEKQRMDVCGPQARPAAVCNRGPDFEARPL